MSQILFDADLAATGLGRKRRSRMSVEAQIVDAYLAARADGDREQMRLIRDHAAAIGPQLVDELDGFDYPAAA